MTPKTGDTILWYTARPGGIAGEVQPDEPWQLGALTPARAHEGDLEPADFDVSSPARLIYLCSILVD